MRFFDLSFFVSCCFGCLDSRIGKSSLGWYFATSLARAAVGFPGLGMRFHVKWHQGYNMIASERAACGSSRGCCVNSVAHADVP